jgi:hypothetical protein
MARTPDPHREVRWAWGFVVLSVAAAVLGQFVSIGIARLLGYPDPEVTPPLGAALLITVPALLISIAPPLAAIAYGIRGGLGGRFSGYAAAGLGALIVVFWVTIAFMALIARA